MVSEDSGHFRQSPEIPETPDKTSKPRKGSRVDRKARGSREEWKWIGSPLTSPIQYIHVLWTPSSVQYSTPMSSQETLRSSIFNSYRVPYPIYTCSVSSLDTFHSSI